MNSWFTFVVAQKYRSPQNVGVHLKKLFESWIRGQAKQLYNKELHLW